MAAPAVPRDYNRWFIQQGYGPGAYPDSDWLDFLGVEEKRTYDGLLRFQAETTRVHETVAPTEATVYDITELSRHVPGYWEMMLAYAKADRAWNDRYGKINGPRSFNSRWSRTKKSLRDLLIKNQRAADSAAAASDTEEEEEEEEEEEDDDDDNDNDNDNDDDDDDEEDEDEDEEGSVESVEE
ncbi:hypothetical protein EYC80_006136 [Monilinia laxa]|uniref:Uncharacterized protein n=1 Tax=Monilinia laxa TaxID=61186 RepID=A0A5N6KGT5_MONLA|nr:hypothetical protein EYC80_006136 [Monilinia laxa]